VTPLLGQPLILCYHAVSSIWPASVAMPESTLARQLSFFRRQGYVGLTFAEAERRRISGKLRRRSLVVTFDDGFASILRALPILEQFHFPATVFVVTRYIESQQPLGWPGLERWLMTDQAGEMRPLGWGDLGALLERGWEVGSHTVNHTHTHTSVIWATWR
jgi:peptidoglycan/xylan/chitin deacetylase (PgdA/CDA1 family)